MLAPPLLIARCLPAVVRRNDKTGTAGHVHKGGKAFEWFKNPWYRPWTISKDNHAAAAAAAGKLRSWFAVWMCLMDGRRPIVGHGPGIAQKVLLSILLRAPIGEYASAVPGSHRASSGDPSRALQARRTAPTRNGKADAISRGGKRVKVRQLAKP